MSQFFVNLADSCERWELWAENYKSSSSSFCASGPRTLVNRNSTLDGSKKLAKNGRAFRSLQCSHRLHAERRLSGAFGEVSNLSRGYFIFTGTIPTIMPKKVCAPSCLNYIKPSLHESDCLAPVTFSSAMTFQFWGKNQPSVVQTQLLAHVYANWLAPASWLFPVMLPTEL